MQECSQTEFGNKSEYLNNGIFENKRILPKEWIAASTKRYFKSFRNEYYGYHWASNSFQFKLKSIPYYLNGGGGIQRAIVIPNYNMVVNFTCGAYNNHDEQVLITNDIITGYILEAIQ